MLPLQDHFDLVQDHLIHHQDEQEIVRHHSVPTQHLSFLLQVLMRVHCSTLNFVGYIIVKTATKSLFVILSGISSRTCCTQSAPGSAILSPPNLEPKALLKNILYLFLLLLMMSRHLCLFDA